MSTVSTPRLPVHSAPKFPGFANLSSAALFDLADACRAGRPLPLGRGECRADVLAEATAELDRRLGAMNAAYEPTPAEREEIEGGDRWDGLG